MDKKEYGKIEIKRDCFAYKKMRSIESCRALRCLYCAKERCAFYKTVEQHKKEMEKYGDREKILVN